MTAYETITLTEDEDGIASLILDRAEKHNALSAQMIEELTLVASEISASESIRAVILKANGKSFCAGGDLNWMKAQMDKPDAEKVREGMKLATMLRALDDLPKPLIACVTGNAFGGGLGMMCVADIVLSVPGAKFGLTETRLGLIPATIGPYVVRRLGEGPSRRIFMNAMIFGADEGQDLGLVTRIDEAGDIEVAAMSEAKAFLACAPRAVAQAKALCKYLARTPGDPMDETAARLAARWADPESLEGITAFFEKRPANWQSS